MTSFIEIVIERFGSLGIGALMFLENIFPPIPSEVILSLSGYYSSIGAIDPYAVWVASVVGSVLGTSLWYFLCRIIGVKRLMQFSRAHGRWITLTVEDIQKAEKWFLRHGAAAVFFGRFVPFIRSVISLPAGLSGMPPGRFLLYTLIGTSLWNSLFIAIGWLLGLRYEVVDQYVGPVSNVILLAMIVMYAYRVATFKTTEQGLVARLKRFLKRF
jgi:membrane protein DedA with SNARE-associated domain